MSQTKVKKNIVSPIQKISETQEYTAAETVSMIKRKTDIFWKKTNELTTLRLFRNAAKKVPAYADFLKKKGIDASTVKTLDDFKKLPAINKKDYLRKYLFEDLCWDGTLAKSLVFTSTSGSTGEPFYFCRSEKLDWQYSIMHELFFKNSGGTKNTSTLVLVCFGMGVWIGGLITYRAFQMLGERGYPISLLAPGINKEEIFKALKKLAPSFDQVILIGYPPFIKDLVDEAPTRDIDLKKLNLKLIFAAEAFTEKFRDHLCQKTGIKNPCLETMNIYGSADIGAMAFESPISILIRRLAIKNPKLFKAIFSDISKTPTLAQYVPDFINFEAPHGEILLTGDSSIPLIRYAIGDHGGVCTYSEMEKILQDHDIDLDKVAQEEGISTAHYKLPFVYVFERIDLSTTLYGLQIYPETIKEVLLDKPFNETLTGKFTLVTEFDEKQDQYLEINLELQKGQEVSPLAKEMLLRAIIDNLLKKNSEYSELYKFIGERAYPRLVFWPAESPNYFKPGIKQSWVVKK